jgi:2-polyprenyl-3-methyl-5-hydroxy-6-metoxy-1,4-benzoquinol methylase
MLEYWIDRYTRQGTLTVGHTSFSAGDLDARTQEVRRRWGGLLKEYLGGAKVLDFGCGVGRLSRILFDLVGVSRVCGTDVVPWAIEEARERVPEGEFRPIGKEGRIPFSAGEFGGVLSWTVLQHVPPEEVGRAANEIMRVMAPGACLFLYENTSALDGKGHIWFRPLSFYLELFDKHATPFHIETVERFDGTDEVHSLVGLRKWS